MKYQEMKANEKKAKLNADFLEQIVWSRLKLLWHEKMIEKRAGRWDDSYLRRKQWLDWALFSVDVFDQKVVKRVVRRFNRKGYRVKEGIRYRWDSVRVPKRKERYLVIFHGIFGREMKRRLDLQDLVVI